MTNEADRAETASPGSKAPPSGGVDGLTRSGASSVDIVAFESIPIRSAMSDDGRGRMFVVADMKAMVNVNPSRAVAPLDDDEKGLLCLKTPGGEQELVAVTEGGLYALALRSQGAMTVGTPQHRFRKWVTSIVIPQVRRTGCYVPPDSFMDRVATDQKLQRLIEVLRKVPSFELLLDRDPGRLARNIGLLNALHAQSTLPRFFPVMAWVGRGRSEGLSIQPSGEVTVGSNSTGACVVTAGVVGFAKKDDPVVASGPQPGRDVWLCQSLTSAALARGLTVYLWVDDFAVGDRAKLRRSLGAMLGVCVMQGLSTRLPPIVGYDNEGRDADPL